MFFRTNRKSQVSTLQKPAQKANKTSHLRDFFINENPFSAGIRNRKLIKCNNRLETRFIFHNRVDRLANFICVNMFKNIKNSSDSARRRATFVKRGIKLAQRDVMLIANQVPVCNDIIRTVSCCDDGIKTGIERIMQYFWETYYPKFRCIISINRD
jgi:hypothetical protein